MTDHFFDGPFLLPRLEACLRIGEGIERCMQFVDLLRERGIHILSLRGPLHVVGVEGRVFIGSGRRNLIWHLSSFGFLDYSARLLRCIMLAGEETHDGTGRYPYLR